MSTATAMLHRRKSISFANIEFKADKPGAFRATIATLNVVDKDGDVTLPGAFPAGKAIVISAYGHTSWYGALPVGKGVIGSDEKTAWVDGEFRLTTQPGKDTYETVKALAAAGLGEWSHGYLVMRSSTDKADLDAFPGAFQILSELDVFEASPVLVGAGEGTVTQSIKSAKREGAKARRVASQKAAVDPELMVQIVQIDFLTDQLDELVDEVMDKLGIVDPDEAEEDAAEAAETQPKNLTLAGHSEFSLAAVQGFLQRVKARAEMRTKDGRVLSSANRERLSSLAEGLSAALADIQELLDSTDPEAGKVGSAGQLKDDGELLQLFDEFQRNRASYSAAGL